MSNGAKNTTNSQKDKFDPIGRLHLFSSIKGGSAKTSTALCYAHELSLQYGDSKTNVYPKVVVIDADVRGTSMEIALLGNEEFVGKKPGDFPNEYYLRDCVGSGHYDDYGNRKYYTDRIVGMTMPTPVKLEDGFIARVAKAEKIDPQSMIDREGEFYVALTNQSQGSRDRFVSASGRGDGAAVSIAYFRTCFKTLLDSLDEMVWEDGTSGTDFIIVDMSPGHDEYVRCIIELCLSDYKDKNVESKRLVEMEKGKKDEDENVLYHPLLSTWEPTLHLMTLPMRQHFNPAIEYLKTVVGATRSNTKHMNRIVLTVVDSYGLFVPLKSGGANKIKDHVENCVRAELANNISLPTDIPLKLRLIPFFDGYKKYAILPVIPDPDVPLDPDDSRKLPFDIILEQYRSNTIDPEKSMLLGGPHYHVNPNYAWDLRYLKEN